MSDPSSNPPNYTTNRTIPDARDPREPIRTGSGLGTGLMVVAVFVVVGLLAYAFYSPATAPVDTTVPAEQIAPAETDAADPAPVTDPVAPDAAAPADDAIPADPTTGNATTPNEPVEPAPQDGTIEPAPVEPAPAD